MNNIDLIKNGARDMCLALGIDYYIGIKYQLGKDGFIHLNYANDHFETALSIPSDRCPIHCARQVVELCAEIEGRNKFHNKMIEFIKTTDISLTFQFKEKS